MSFNLATILTETTLAAPDAPVCRFGGTTTTYRELDELSGRAAAGLREAGLSPGQVVALQLPNIPQFLIAYFGALKAGLVVLPLNPRARARSTGRATGRSCPSASRCGACGCGSLILRVNRCHRDGGTSARS